MPFDAIPAPPYNYLRGTPVMRKDLIEILACPICKSPLELTVAEEVGEEVVRGHLTCKQCSEDYPIEDRIPNLLPPEMRTS
jgi:uncharacterized protein YbaR (Trm112 family)